MRHAEEKRLPSASLSFPFEPTPRSSLQPSSASKPTMGHQDIWFSHPRKFGPGSRHCRVCSNHHGLIRKYGLHMCRRCFRQYANQIGFKKLD